MLLLIILGAGRVKADLFARTLVKNACPAPARTCTLALSVSARQAEAAERKLTQEAEECTSQLKEEFSRFDEDKVRDFQQSAAQLVQSLIESQKKVTAHARGPRAGARFACPADRVR